MKTKHTIDQWIGKRFGTREVIGGGEIINRYFTVNVKCDCGTISSIPLSRLISGGERSCSDCARRNQTGNKNNRWKGGRHISMTVYNAWRSSSIRRGIPWEINIDILDALLDAQDFKCTLTGEILTIGHGNGNGLIVNGTASLDRIDSRIGYLIGNIQFVIKSVNMAKQAMSERDFIDLCRRVYLYRGGINE